MQQPCKANRFDGAEELVRNKVTPSTDINTDLLDHTHKVKFLYLKKRPLCYPSQPSDSTSPPALADEHKLRKIVDELSLQLRALVAEKGFADDAVVELSQKLDIYIVQLQYIIRQKAAARLS
ncbi:aspartyl-phosphate phosphatase Spo0E family protein [Brevibacillus humidisoli]|uniref:aspartyl-phosphate phosphatase Spo0E family protein n=1 Tax=Brevibacillus humidisoli TaxID=2895522 RepID=UPI001E5BDD7D|nr:aspartyl-phosphate phosphatase Spo0E family protein [Brevibacillus humidisoli]UFJ38996.1 aspartyl-phosphate phosphatase Spo0E family protein [Brevibacillus humidisoli]